MFRSYGDCWSSCPARHVEFGLNMPVYVPDSGRRCLFVLLLGGNLAGSDRVFSGIARCSISRSGMRAFPLLKARIQFPMRPKSPMPRRPDSSDGKFLSRWAKRGLRDQADIYTAPFHRSELKWVIGLPAVTLGLIAIDKHASERTIEKRN